MEFRRILPLAFVALLSPVPALAQPGRGLTLSPAIAAAPRLLMPLFNGHHGGGGHISFGSSGPFGHHGPPISHHHGRPPIVLIPPLLYFGSAYGWLPYTSPLMVGAGGGVAAFMSPIPAGSGIVNPPVAPPVLAARMVPPAPRARRRDPARMEELTTFGDRLFRAGNLARATERYEQAVRADVAAATPRLRLAQVATRRGNYKEAATRLREAQAAEPGWLLNAPDIQPLFGDPADFARLLGRIESHLQAHPSDRDAWLVLGAELYLSGRSRQASDIFLRLTDRPADETLTAFLDATKAR